MSAVVYKAGLLTEQTHSQSSALGHSDFVLALVACSNQHSDTMLVYAKLVRCRILSPPAGMTLM